MGTANVKKTWKKRAAVEDKKMLEKAKEKLEGVRVLYDKTRQEGRQRERRFVSNGRVISWW